MEEKGKDYEERRGRGRGRGRGRPRGRAKAPPRGLRVKKRNMIESEEEEEEQIPDENEPPKAKQYDQDCDISSLEAPTFTTLDRGPPAPMLRLSWDHRVNLIGEKVLSPRIHICDACNKPILIYGRMIPCKHVFCLWCARSEDRVCARCGERVARVEQTGLGTVFMCNYTINKAVCKRTYLSQRDLQAHIDHRHMKMSGTGGAPKEDIKEERLSHRDPRGEGRDSRGDPRGDMRQDPRSMTDPRIGKEGYEHRDSYSAASQFSRQGSGQFGSSNNHPQPHQSPSSHQSSSHNISLIPVMTSSRTNLITVPLQDPPEHTSSHSPFPHPSPTHPPPSHLPPTHPPPAHSFTSPPPAHSQTQPYSSTFTTPYNTHSTHNTHNAHSTHNTHNTHTTHNTHNTHNSHNTHNTHNTHSTHSTHNTHSTQSAQYTYPPIPATAPQQSHTVPPPLYSNVAPTVPPPTTYGNRPQYEGQYGTTQWSTPPPQAAPSHQSAPSLHHSSLSSVQSSQYYRKNF